MKQLQIINNIFLFKMSFFLLILLITIIFLAKPSFGENPQVNTWNNQLNQIDNQYQFFKNQPGGITSTQKTTIINAKTNILTQAQLGSFNSYDSFVDTKISIVDSPGNLFLVRRGKEDELFSKYGLGRWFSEGYRSVKASRKDLAILESWGNSLNTIYVINVPADKLSIEGIASPQTSSNGLETEPGGAKQYWLLNNNKETSDWVLYAIYGKDHLKSYATSITTAQRLGNTLINDVQNHFENLRIDNLYAMKSSNQLSKKQKSYHFWFKPYGFNISNFTSNNKTSNLIHSNNAGFEKSINFKNSNLYAGVFSGYAKINSTIQTDKTTLIDYGDINNSVSSIHGGLYTYFQEKKKDYYKPVFFANTVISSGYLHFVNKIPGILHKGFNQGYDGANFITASTAGFTSALKYGFNIEPQLEINFNKIMHENFKDKIFAPVHLSKGSSFKTDVGFKIRKNLLQKEKYKIITYLKANYQREFMGKNIINIMDEEGTDNQKGNYFQLGGGFNINFFKRLVFRAEMLKLLGKEKGFLGNFTFFFNI